MVICMRKVRELHNKILNEPGVHQSKILFLFYEVILDISD